MSINFPSIRRYLLTIGGIGAVVSTVLLLNFDPVRNTIVRDYGSSIELLHFLLIAITIAGAFLAYRNQNQRWLFLITTTTAIFNYFFVFVYRGPFPAYLSIIVLLGLVIWDLLRKENTPPSTPPETPPQN